MSEITLSIAIAAIVLDGISTWLGLRLGMVEVGPVSVRVIGRRPNGRDLVFWHLAKIAAVAALWALLPGSLQLWVIGGIAAGTAFVAVRNFVRIARR